MNWIKVSEDLPNPESQYTEFLVVIEWADYILDHERKNHVTVARFNAQHKLFISVSDTHDGSIIDNGDTYVTHWMPKPEAPEIDQSIKRV